MLNVLPQSFLPHVLVTAHMEESHMGEAQFWETQNFLVEEKKIHGCRSALKNVKKQ